MASIKMVDLSLIELSFSDFFIPRDLVTNATKEF
jgi:hypothetical protein